MPYKMSPEGNLEYSIAPKGFEGAEDVINQRKNKTVPNIYESFGAGQPSEGKQFAESLVMGGLPMLLGGAASSARGEGFGAGMAPGAIKGIENIFEHSGAQERALGKRRQGILESPEMVTAYDKSKERFGMFEDDAPGFQSILEEEMAGQSAASLKAKRSGTGPLGLLSQEYGVPKAWKMWKEHKGETSRVSDVQTMKELNRVDRVFNQRRDDLRVDTSQGRLSNEESVKGMSALNDWYNNAMVEVDSQRKVSSPPSYTPRIKKFFRDVPAEFSSEQEGIDVATQGAPDLSLPARGTTGGKIRVRSKTGKHKGRTGTISSGEWDTNLYEKVE